MRKIYYLSSCSTCKRILNELGEALTGFEVQDIKKKLITGDQLQQMKDLAGSYEALFSRRSRSYQSMGLADKQLGEDDFRELILKDYTFLARPVFIVDDRIFVGNSARTIDALREYLLL